MSETKSEQRQKPHINIPNKKITCVGYVNGVEGVDDHFGFQVEITPSLLKRIQHLAAAVRSAKAVHITDFSGGVRVFGKIPDTAGAVIFDGWGSSWRFRKNGHADGEPVSDEDQTLADCMRIVVDEHGDFQWRWYPRHWDGADFCATPWFSFSEVVRKLKRYGAAYNE